MQRQVGRLLANHAARADQAPAAGGDEAKRAFDAMMGMKKIDVAAINGTAQLTSHHKRTGKKNGFDLQEDFDQGGNRILWSASGISGLYTRDWYLDS